MALFFFSHTVLLCLCATQTVFCTRSKSVITSSPPPLLYSLSSLPSPPCLGLHFLVHSVNDATLFMLFHLSLATRLSVLSLTQALFMNLVNTGTMYLSSLLLAPTACYCEFTIPQISYFPCVLTPRGQLSAAGIYFTTPPVVFFAL